MDAIKAWTAHCKVNTQAPTFTHAVLIYPDQHSNLLRASQIGQMSLDPAPKLNLK